MRIFKKREEGQGLVEYALLLVLVAMVVIGILALMGGQLRNAYSRVIVALGGNDPNAYTYTITGFSVSGSGGMGGCAVTLNSLSVHVTNADGPASGVGVNVSVSLQSGGGTTLNGTTNSSGNASWGSRSIGTDPNGCGRTATASVGGVSRTNGY